MVCGDRNKPKPKSDHHPPHPTLIAPCNGQAFLLDLLQRSCWKPWLNTGVTSERPTDASDGFSKSLPESSLVAVWALVCPWEQHRRKQLVAAACAAAAAPAPATATATTTTRTHCKQETQHDDNSSNNTSSSYALAVALKPTPYIAPQPRVPFRCQGARTIETAGGTQKRDMCQVQPGTAVETVLMIDSINGGA